MDLKKRLHSHLIQIVRDRNPYLASAGHFYVQQYIREQLGQWGTVETDDFAVRGRIHHNLLLDLPPLNPLTGAGFLVKALSHNSLRLRASCLVKPLHCLDLLSFARGKPTPVSPQSPPC